jgi:hypothetical protein
MFVASTGGKTADREAAPSSAGTLWGQTCSPRVPRTKVPDTTAATDIRNLLVGLTLRSGDWPSIGLDPIKIAKP